MDNYKRVRVPRSNVKGCNGCAFNMNPFLCIDEGVKCMVTDSQGKVRFYIFVPKEEK